MKTSTSWFASLVAHPGVAMFDFSNHDGDEGMVGSTNDENGQMMEHGAHVHD